MWRKPRFRKMLIYLSLVYFCAVPLVAVTLLGLHEETFWKVAIIIPTLGVGGFSALMIRHLWVQIIHLKEAQRLMREDYDPALEGMRSALGDLETFDQWRFDINNQKCNTAKDKINRNFAIVDGTLKTDRDWDLQSKTKGQ